MYSYCGPVREAVPYVVGAWVGCFAAEPAGEDDVVA